MGEGKEEPILSEEELAALCKALAHPIRVKIVNHLKRIDQCICGDIVDIFTLSQSTVSQHLKQLKQAGLIKGEIEGPRTCYCLNWSVFQRFKESVAQL